MSRITETFARLRSRHEVALIPYLTAGFPSAAATPILLDALVRGGADIIELGIPFSDPIADGPTIQRASAEALDAGMTLAKALGIVRDFRSRHSTPIVLFGAYNPFLTYGLERLAGDAASSGVDALLIPDLPADERDEARPALASAGLDLIPLVAPTSPPDRKAMITSGATGFVYYISAKGVTGARKAAHFDLEAPIREIRAVTDLPVAVGFGIATPEQAREVARLADAVVVGSALIDLVSRNRDSSELGSSVEAYMSSLKAQLTRDTSA